MAVATILHAGVRDEEIGVTNNIRHPETAPKQSVTRRQRTGPSQGRSKLPAGLE
jgi:hypothetical protein